MSMEVGTGPLAGVRVVEFGGIGPGPHCAMLLSDMGAQVLRIDRPGRTDWPNPIIERGRFGIELDIRGEEERGIIHQAIRHADVLIEGYRPGVMERLGYGPGEMLGLNPRLIYGRMTGWGQTGPLARAAGHDINYIALTGALAAITSDDGRPIPPLNLVGDYGGGSLFLALGIVAALFERRASGMGQVIDAAILDGVASLMTPLTGLTSAGLSLDPERNPLAGRAPNYRCYECADGRYISIGPVEPGFHAFLLERIGAPPQLVEQWHEATRWPDRVRSLAAIFARRTRDEWCALLEGTDACFAPVLTYAESLEHPQVMERNTYVEVDGMTQAAPAPRFSRTAGKIGPSGDGRALIRHWTASEGFGHADG